MCKPTAVSVGTHEQDLRSGWPRGWRDDRPQGLNLIPAFPANASHFVMSAFTNTVNASGVFGGRQCPSP
jgi:hypothetical protein